MEGTSVSEPTNPSLETVAVSDMRFIPGNRDIFERNLTKFRPWNDRAAGVVELSLRDDGYYWILDGQHRIHEAAINAAPTEMLAKVWRKLSHAEEADVWLTLNRDRTAFKATEKFRAAIIAQHADQLSILRIAEELGYKIGDDQGDGIIRAVSALEWVYGAGRAAHLPRRPGTLESTLGVLSRAWGYDQDAVAGELIRGLGAFIVRYEGQIDIPDLTHKLSKYSGGPLALVGRAKHLRAAIGATVPNCVAEAIVETYNKGRRSANTRLPGWRS